MPKFCEEVGGAIFLQGQGHCIGLVSSSGEDLPQSDAGQDDGANSALEYWQLTDAPSNDDWLENLPGPWRARDESRTIITAGGGGEPSGDEELYQQTDYQAQGCTEDSPDPMRTVSPVPMGAAHPSQKAVAQAALDRLHSAAASAQLPGHRPTPLELLDLFRAAGRNATEASSSAPTYGAAASAVRQRQAQHGQRFVDSEPASDVLRQQAPLPEPQGAQQQLSALLQAFQAADIAGDTEPPDMPEQVESPRFMRPHDVTVDFDLDPLDVSEGMRI